MSLISDRACCGPCITVCQDITKNPEDLSPSIEEQSDSDLDTKNVIITSNCKNVTDGTNCHTMSTNGTVAMDTKATYLSHQTSHKNVEELLREMKINELSANDDEDDASKTTTNRNGQTSSHIRNRPAYVTSTFEYDMDHKARGKAIIVNNVNFERETGMSNRAGSEKDADELTDVLRMLGFNTERYDDLTCFQLLRIFQDVSAEDHSDYDCFMCAIMTHGTDGAIYCIDGVLSPDEIIQELKGDRCVTLSGKPKICFIQACRGQRLDEGVDLKVGEDITDETDSRNKQYGSLVIPSEADFLVAYSSPPGYYSWRNVSYGSWFIQALIKVLKDFGTSLEINQLLIRVNHIVAYEYMSSSTIPGFNKKKQMPYYTSTLTKELYFKV